ncbi:MAG: rane protein [Oscillospiraceae bacterium]|nr:rane protein [Oscillospiraceae bacterium]
MNEETRLPRNGKEGLLYGGIIAAISAMIMTTVNIGIAFGRLDKEVILVILKVLPINWAIAMLLALFIEGRIANKFVRKFTEPTDGFNAKILFNILFCVIGMSVCMTVTGGLLGELISGTGLSWEPFLTFPLNWPRNFCIALWCEILIAQPMARSVMKRLHAHQNEIVCTSE